MCVNGIPRFRHPCQGDSNSGAPPDGCARPIRLPPATILSPSGGSANNIVRTTPFGLTQPACHPHSQFTDADLQVYNLRTSFEMNCLEKLKFNADGLIPAIVQEQGTGRVLMMAWMNKESLAKTIESGKTVFWSRSRKQFWVKGETSGHFQVVKDIAVDCDGDTLLIQVDQTGAACHEGYKSCFFRSVRENGAEFEVTEGLV